MDKINFIFRQLLDVRKNSAISFQYAGEAELYSGKIYWEYLNQLKEECDSYLKGYGFFTKIIIKDNIIQIEWYSQSTGEVPYATFKLAVTSELNDINKNSFKNLDFYSYITTILKCQVANAIQVISIQNNLVKQLELFQYNAQLRESDLNWQTKVLKQMKLNKKITKLTESDKYDFIENKKDIYLSVKNDPWGVRATAYGSGEASISKYELTIIGTWKQDDIGNPVKYFRVYEFDAKDVKNTSIDDVHQEMIKYFENAKKKFKRSV